MTLPASGAIAFSCINTELCRSSTAQLSMNCSSVRTLFGQASGAICMNTGHGKSNTTVPGAPTSVGGSATSSSAISVTFSAPASNGGLSIDLYQAISSPGCITATAASSPISVTGLSASTSYTFRVRAHNSKGYGCYSSSSGSITTPIPPGSQSYTTTGTYTWIAPTNVTSVSIVAIGGGAGGHSTYFCCGGYFSTVGGGGGTLAYKNNRTVVPGNSYRVVVGREGYGKFRPGGCSQFSCTTSYITNPQAGGGSSNGPNCGGTGDGVYKGADANGGTTLNAVIGGGGAGGYSGRGGRGGLTGASGSAGSGGGGGGGGGFVNGNGGGTGLYSGCSGAGGTSGSPAGGAGSGGSGMSYGGGSFACQSTQTYRCGASGAVRIVWPGNYRQFPSTCVGA